MKVVILGSGVIGVTLAYYLAEDGHEVEVVDRQSGPALETSFGNAGEVSPGYSSPWAGPGLPLKAIKWLAMEHAPLVVRWTRMNPAMAVFGLKLLRNCTTHRYEVNKGRMVRIAEYSRDCLVALRQKTGLHYDARMQGTLQLFRTQEQMDHIHGDTEVLDRYGVPYEVLDPAGCIAVEPALARVREKFVGGLRLPHDETGDCFKFTNALAELAAAKGVRFTFGRTILSIEQEKGAITGVVTDAGRVVADAYVMALGSYSPRFLKPLGIHVPIYPVKGYSLTVPITDPAGAPESTVMDETFKVAVTRLGDRIRIGGTAELTGFDLTLHPERRATLEHVVGDLFPDGGEGKAGTFWTGLRPMTPDGTPLLGPTRYPNLHLATGHGTLGWTMAAGTGRAMADLISGRKPEIDMDGLTIARYG
ncbi:MAG: D-amino acid dehydrogenase [Pseudomonadota bacterium]